MGRRYGLAVLSRFPVVVLGDFNAPPAAEELQPMYEAFRDAWASGDRAGGETFPADDPVRRIDGILVTPDVRVDSAAVVRSTASDHLPVWADLILRW